MVLQLFINYRLKSVAALPWRAFTYRAFDDIFAFIITMPTAHRVACFRDDIVFLIYLYQRWLYPVDKTKTDDISNADASTENEVENKKNSVMKIFFVKRFYFIREHQSQGIYVIILVD